MNGAKMLLMSDRLDFSHWLQIEREKRGWSQNELANRANIGRAIINKTESGSNDPAPKTLQALARAFGYPVEALYRIAGYLPVVPNNDPLIEEGIFILKQLEGEDKEEALRYLRLRREVQSQRGHHAQRGKPRPATT